MKLSCLVGRTLRNAPSGYSSEGEKLLAKAGYISLLHPGIYTFLPMAMKTIGKIEILFRKEAEKINAQEICLPEIREVDPLVHPQARKGLRATSSYIVNNQEDRRIYQTIRYHVQSLIRQEIVSCRHLPKILFQIKGKDKKPSTLKDDFVIRQENFLFECLAFVADNDRKEDPVKRFTSLISNIAQQCQLDLLVLNYTANEMYGSSTVQYVCSNPHGKYSMFFCNTCGYVASTHTAQNYKDPPAAEDARDLEIITTPGCNSIEALTAFLGIPKSKTCKALFLIASFSAETGKPDRMVVALVRGDMMLNNHKLLAAIDAEKLRFATDDEIIKCGMVPGYASPIGAFPLDASNDFTSRPLIVVDELIPKCRNLVSGANQADAHYVNTNFPRDYLADLVVDITQAELGLPCPICRGQLNIIHGRLIGSTTTLNSTFLAAPSIDIRNHPNQMGFTYTHIDLGEVLLAIAEKHKDENGLILPRAIAPFLVYLLPITNRKDPSLFEISEMLYNDLQKAGIDTLFDDRELSPGEKFHDADLLGIPLRVTISRRAMDTGGVEIKLRSQSEKRIIPFEAVVTFIMTEQRSHPGIVVLPLKLP